MARRTELGRAVLAATMVAGCGGGSGLPPEHREAADRALGYLESTDAEMGADVVMTLQVHADRTGSARAARIAEQRAAEVLSEASEVERRLLEIDKPAPPRRRLDGVEPPGAPPDPDDRLGDDRAARCPEAMLQCRVPDECRDFARLEDRGGYVLTHQAFWIVLAHWAGCETEVDVESRRRAIAARLVAETRADPEPSDLYAERLAMLGALGFDRAIERGWVDALVEAQQPEGCFPADAEVTCHPHPTGLALWTLASTAR